MGKRISTAIVAMALVLGLFPGAAMAGGESSLSAGAVKSPASTSVSTSKASLNEKAHKAYKKKIAKLKQDNMSFGKCRFIDLTNDGIDEMVMMWWPSIYTYKSGKVKRVDSASAGSESYPKAWKKKKVVVRRAFDHMGSYSDSYLKWNGKKFVRVATLYTPGPSGRSLNYQPYYWVKGKGKVSKKTAKVYVKKLVGSARATKITYKQY